MFSFNRFTEYIFSSMKIEIFNIVNKKFFFYRFTFFAVCGIMDNKEGEKPPLPPIFGVFFRVFPP